MRAVRQLLARISVLHSLPLIATRNALLTVTIAHQPSSMFKDIGLGLVFWLVLGFVLAVAVLPWAKNVVAGSFYWPYSLLLHWALHTNDFAVAILLSMSLQLQ